MIKFMQELTTVFKAVTTNSHHAINRDTTVTYPYLTFDIDSEGINRNQEGFYIDVDLFDNQTSYARILALEQSLKDHMRDLRLMTDDLYIRFEFNASTKVPTADETIIRRNLRFYAKTDWRKN